MKWWLVGSLVVTIGPLSLALADVVELKTGQRVEGTLKQATPAGVAIEVGGQTITFTGDKVRAIYFGAAPTPVAAPSAQAAASGPAFKEAALRAADAIGCLPSTLSNDKMNGTTRALLIDADKAIAEAR